MTPLISRTVKFVRDIGIPVHLVKKTNGFLPMIEIRKGQIFMTNTCPVCDLLHETGHLAIIPSPYRHSIGRSVDDGIIKMLKDISNRNLHPDHPISRAAMQSGDCEATAWAWAAGIHLGIAPEKIIRNKDYDKTGNDIRTMLSLNSYFGINGLAHAGFCSLIDGQEPIFPKLRYWTQEFDSIIS